MGKYTSCGNIADVLPHIPFHREKLHHLGMRGKISRSTLADANESRDFRIYQDLGYAMIRTARKLYHSVRK